MSQEYIRVHGARENNLKNVSLDIPKRKITVFTGVSGSGKSSLVFDTLAAESQRLLNENFSLFARNFLPKYPQPEVDAIENLNMAVIVDQKRLGGGAHSTVGTITDVAPALRLLFARAGTPRLAGPWCFSFNDPAGMCPTCNGMGRALGLDMAKALDESKSLNQGALLMPDYAVGGWDWSLVVQTGFFDLDKPVNQYSEEERRLLLHCKGHKVKTQIGTKSMNLTYDGVVEKFTNKYILKDLKSYSERTQKSVEPYLVQGSCPLCEGARLSPTTLACRIDGHNIADLSALEVDDLAQLVSQWNLPEVAPLLATLQERLSHLVDIGLGYLSLNRETDTLSGGESQRVKMVKHLNGALVDVLYVFDEPSIGLHPRDVHRLNELLVRLRDQGNTVLVVEHDPDVIRIADHVVDMGPLAGGGGGTVVFEGTFSELKASSTLTGRHLSQALPLKTQVRPPSGWLEVSGARANNLKNVSVKFPQGVLTVVTGVAGSGKSSLVHQAFLPRFPDAVVIDQSAVGTSTRSNPATYTGLMDDLRKLFATAHKVSPALFSFNSQGACETCHGLGVTYTDLAFLDEVKLPCEACGGKRFKEEVLAYKVDGLSITDVLGLAVNEARQVLKQKEFASKLKALDEVGLGYMTLGQPLSSLSGGECQRIKLATELQKTGTLYVLDEPTTGLHPSDIRHLLEIIHRLVDAGNTVVVIEHNLYVIRSADWVIDLGPEGGSRGGQVLYEGPPAGLSAHPASLTGAFLVPVIL